MQEPHHLGDSIILQVGISYLETDFPGLGVEISNALIQAMAEYLTFANETSYSRAQEMFFSCIGRDEPLIKLKEIVETSPEPMPLPIEPTEEDGIPKKKTRPWGPAEDTRLLAAIYRYGIDNWTKVSEFVGSGRSRAQCCQRWTRGLNPRISKDSWNYDEDMKLIELVKTYGDKAWTKIAQMMGNRSDVQCRYHYHQVQRDLPALIHESYRSQYIFPNHGGFQMPIQSLAIPKSSGRSSVPQINPLPPVFQPQQQVNPQIQHQYHRVSPPASPGQNGYIQPGYQQGAVIPQVPTGRAGLPPRAPPRLLPVAPNVIQSSRRTSLPVTSGGFSNHSGFQAMSLDGFLSNFT